MKNVTLKIFSLLFLAFFLNSNFVFSQSVKISDNAGVPNANAILDVDISTNDAGILIPRLTTTQRNDLSTNAPLGATDEGLTVYDETLKAFVFWTGTEWKQLTTQGANWSVIGNSAINSTSNFIGTVDANDFVIKTNNTERARLTSDGKIGINTTSPDVYLHIFGDDATTVSDDATYTAGTGLLVIGDMSARNLVLDQNEILARNGNTQSSLYLQNRGGDIRIHYDRPTTTHDDGSQVIIKDNGQIGIGFLSPQDMLHIYAPEPYLRFEDKDGGSEWNMGVNGNNTRFQIAEDDGTYYPHRFVIKQGGFVGIGTTAPEGLLHIKADDTNSATLLIDADRGDNANDTWKLRSDATTHNLDFYNDVDRRISFTSTGRLGIGTNNPQKVLHILNSVPYIRLDDTDGGNFWEVGNSGGEFRIYEDTNERFEIEAGGNVGIGTDDPDAKLHVLNSGTIMGQYAGTVAAFQQNGAAGDWARISIIGGNTGASIIDFGDADKQDAGMLKYDHTDNFLSYSYNDGATQTEILRIEDYGYVGIGETNPSEKLDVDGAILIGNTTNSNTGAIRWNGSNFQGYKSGSWVNLDAQPTGSAGGWTDDGANVRLTTIGDNVGGSIRMTDGNEGANKTMVSDANGTASWSNENDGVKTRVIQLFDGGDSETTIWTHPENIVVTFNPLTENVKVENKSTDATNYWDVTIIGGATGRESVETTKYKADYIRDDGTNDSLSKRWFHIKCCLLWRWFKRNSTILG